MKVRLQTCRGNAPWADRKGSPTSKKEDSDVCFIPDTSWLKAVENLNQEENKWKALCIKL